MKLRGVLVGAVCLCSILSLGGCKSTSTIATSETATEITTQEITTSEVEITVEMKWKKNRKK